MKALAKPLQVCVTDGGEPLLWAAVAYSYDDKVVLVGDMTPAGMAPTRPLLTFSRRTGYCVHQPWLRLLDYETLNRSMP